MCVGGLPLPDPTPVSREAGGPLGGGGEGLAGAVDTAAGGPRSVKCACPHETSDARAS